MANDCNFQPPIADFRFMIARWSRDFEGVLSRLQRGRQRVHLPTQEGAWRHLPGTFFHAVPEMFIQTGGGTDFHCPGGSFASGTRDVCVMPSGVPHGEQPRDLRNPYEIVVCWPVSDGFVLHRSKSPHGEIQAEEMAHFVSMRGKAAFRHLEEMTRPVSGPYREVYVQSLLTAFCIDLLEELQRPEPATSDVSPLMAGIERRARPLLADPELSVAGLAVLAGCSPDHLSRKFRRASGISLGQWITRERLALARDLLQDRRLSVAEVGWACGFRAASYFIRVFRNQSGLTPGAWREIQPDPEMAGVPIN